MTAPRRVRRSRMPGWKWPEGAVYVGRPSVWGNPFTVDTHGSREAAVAAYDEAIRRDTRQDFFYLDVAEQEAQHLPTHELRGKDLMCWCPLDQPCHADILLRLANEVARG